MDLWISTCILSKNFTNDIDYGILVAYSYGCASIRIDTYKGVEKHEEICLYSL